MRAVHEAFALGINYFDTSPFYGETRSEQVLWCCGGSWALWCSAQLGSGMMYTEACDGTPAGDCADRTTLLAVHRPLALTASYQRHACQRWDSPELAAGWFPQTHAHGQGCLNIGCGVPPVQVLGRGLKDLPRDQIIVATKVTNPQMPVKVGDH